MLGFAPVAAAALTSIKTPAIYAQACNVSGHTALTFSLALTPATNDPNWINALIARSSNATVLDVEATNCTGDQGYLIGYNATSIPPDGALTSGLVLDYVPVAAHSTVRINDMPGLGTNYSNGVVFFFSEAGAPFMKSTGLIAGLIKVRLQ